MPQPETPSDPPQRASTAAPPGAPDPEPADADAPVDWQADPATWLRGRTVLVVAIISAVILVVTIVICLLQWFTPAMEPLQIPRVEQA